MAFSSRWNYRTTPKLIFTFIRKQFDIESKNCLLGEYTIWAETQLNFFFQKKKLNLKICNRHKGAIILWGGGGGGVMANTREIYGWHLVFDSSKKLKKNQNGWRNRNPGYVLSGFIVWAITVFPLGFNCMLGPSKTIFSLGPLDGFLAFNMHPSPDKPTSKWKRKRQSRIELLFKKFFFLSLYCFSATLDFSSQR